MSPATKEKLLRPVLLLLGITFFMLYPLAAIWPSGWVWHGGEGIYYFQMIAGIYATLGAFLIWASRNPTEHRSLIWFTCLSSLVHALIMAVQASGDHHERGHLVGDVPAMLIVAAVIWYLMPRRAD